MGKAINTIYLADTLSVRYPNFERHLLDALRKENKEVVYLPGTKDVWCEDYMPIKNGLGNLILFRYFPSYVRFKKYLDKITDAGPICDKMSIPYTRSELIVDGGNVLLHKNKAILTDRIFKDDLEGYSQTKILDKLAKALEAELIIIPAQPNDFTGHADGIIRWLNDDTVLINKNTPEENQRFVKKLRKTLEEAGLKIIEVPTGVYANKSLEDATGIYLNYLQLEDVILLPIYGTEMDNEVVELFEELFSEHKIIPVLSDDIAKGGGVINCSTWGY